MTVTQTSSFPPIEIVPETAQAEQPTGFPTLHDPEVILGHKVRYYEDALFRLIDEAFLDGVVITVSQVPRLPLAMGNYETVVAIRPDHETVGKIMAAKKAAQ